MDLTTLRTAFIGAGGAVVAIGLFAMFTAPIPADSTDLAASPELAQLNFGKELAPSQCKGKGEPLVSVTQKIKNDADSGQAGNYWGMDEFTRVIQLWPGEVGGTYCAVVRYTGSFVAAEGQRSPGDTGVLTGKEKGPVQGGYVATISGDLLDEPLWKVNGSVGTTDYQCDTLGNCPGAVNWVTQYFAPGYTFDYAWWGWVYRAGGKQWVNSSNGNSGDIL